MVGNKNSLDVLQTLTFMHYLHYFFKLKCNFNILTPKSHKSLIKLKRKLWGVYICCMSMIHATALYKKLKLIVLI